MSYRAIVVGTSLLSLLSGAAQAQSACGLQGYLSCTNERSGQTTGYGCCPVGYECYATECEFKGRTPTSTAPPIETTACPGFPAHHLCPEASGGGCCYNAHACDPDNVSQCTLTKTERVFDEIVTTTTVKNGKTETITTTSIFYPWATVEPRVSPSGGGGSGASQTSTSSDDTVATATAPDTTDGSVTKTSVITVSNEPETTPAPLPSGSGTDGGKEETSSSSSTSTGGPSTAAAGNLQAQMGAVIGGLVAGLMVQN